jgi:hypothetical protein
MRLLRKPANSPLPVKPGDLRRSSGLYLAEAAPAPHYNHQAMRDSLLGWELTEYNESHSVAGFLSQTNYKAFLAWLFFTGHLLTAPLLTFPFLVNDRRVRLLWLIAAACAAGTALEIFFKPHYAAPLTAVIVAFNGTRTSLSSMLELARPACGPRAGTPYVAGLLSRLPGRCRDSTPLGRELVGLRVILLHSKPDTSRAVDYPAEQSRRSPVSNSSLRRQARSVPGVGV